MEDKTKIGLIGALTILIAFGGYMALTQEEIDNSYYCIGDGNWGIFYGGISSTGLTAYPFLENRSSYVRCYYDNGVKSEWVPLIEYAAELNVTVEDLLAQEPPQIETERIGKKYICSTTECIEVS